MATFKVLLDKRRQLQDGTYPLVVRIYNGDKFSTISLKTYLKETQFDEVSQKVKGNHPNKKEINQKIRQATLKVEKTTLNLELHEELISAEKIKSTIVAPKPKLNFTQFGEKIIEDFKAVNRVGNAVAYRGAINALKTYSGKEELQFSEVNFELLTIIGNKMLAKGLSKNSIAAYNRALRAIYNRAINEDLVDIKFYPYRKYKIKGESTPKRNITKEGIAAIMNLELAPQSELWHARNYFILSFNLRGISFADMAAIKVNDIINGRLIYKRKKTHKLYNIKLTEKAKEILEMYQQGGRTYILPVLSDDLATNPAKQRTTIQQAIKVCNKYLRKVGEQAEIKQEVTTYVARHSWATIAKKMGYSKDLISEALGHSFGNRVTEVYLDSFDQEVIDEMNSQVCNLGQKP